LGVDAKDRDMLEAAVLRRLIGHLQKRTDVQNIDLMNLAGFCRNCLSNWLEDAAKENGIALSRDDARQHVYGMPHADWKRLYQAEATPAQADAFAKKHTH
jgi:uncharacterized protein